MKRRDFFRYASSLAVCLAAAGQVSLAGAATATRNPLFDLVLPDSGGQQQALDQWLGRPLVVNFWATWCPPCLKEMPDLEALHQAHQQVAFVGLAVDTAANVRRFSEKVQVSYPLLLLGHSGIELMRTLGNKSGGLPFTLVFDQNGAIAETLIGQIKPDQLEHTIQALL